MAVDPNLDEKKWGPGGRKAWDPGYRGPAPAGPVAPAPGNPPPGNPPSSPAKPSGGWTGQDLIERLVNMNPNMVDFASTPGFMDIANNWAQHGGPIENAVQNLRQYTDAFTQMYTNQVGAAPTKDAYNQFFQQVLQPSQPWTKQVDSAKLQTDLNAFVGQNFSGVAHDIAEKKAQDQAAKAVAPGSAFDQWQQSYMSSLNDTEKALTDYQTRLFEKLRPNLITSLKAQGLLDTGALDTAFAGAASDSNAAVQNFMANARVGANQDINNRKFAITQAPNDFALSNTFNGPPNLTSAGQNALNNAFSNYQLTRNFDYNSANQPQQPSLLQGTAGLIAGGMASGLGRGFGNRLAGG